MADLLPIPLLKYLLPLELAPLCRDLLLEDLLEELEACPELPDFEDLADTALRKDMLLAPDCDRDLERGACDIDLDCEADLEFNVEGGFGMGTLLSFLSGFDFDHFFSKLVGSTQIPNFLARSGNLEAMSPKTSCLPKAA